MQEAGERKLGRRSGKVPGGGRTMLPLLQQDEPAGHQAMQDKIARLKKDLMNATNTIRQLNNIKTKVWPKGAGKSSTMTLQEQEEQMLPGQQLKQGLSKVQG